LLDDAFPVDAAAHRRAAALAVDGAAVDDGVDVLRLGDLFDVALGDVTGLGLGGPRLQGRARGGL